MLNISRVQLEAFAEPFDASFMERVRQFLKSETPQLVERAGNRFEQQLEAGLRDARALGMLSEQEQTLNVVLSLLYGEGFASRQEWAVSVVDAHREAGYRSGLAESLMKAAMPSPEG